MATLDPYAACPCGSGNKFKWCCQPIYDDILAAFHLEQEGQHEGALRKMEELVAKHPNNAEAWGRKAQLLYQQQRFEDGDKALQTAFEKNPRYPFGHYLQGRLLHGEGEIAGALTMFRRAVECYDPASRPVLAELQSLIFDCEIKLNHPLAARAALALAIGLNPASDELRKAMEQLFGDKSHLPPCARREYKYMSLPADASPERRAAWQKALASSARLSEAVTAFRLLTEEDPKEPAAWYNLGLSQAWLGNNLPAIEALEIYLGLETDDERAAQAAALVEVLCCGMGAEDRADLVENLVMIASKNVEALVKYIQKLQGEQRLIGAEMNEDDRVLTALILEKPVLALTPSRTPRLGAALMLMGNLLTLRNTNKPALTAVADDVRQALGASVAESREVRAPARFSDLFSEAMQFPLGIEDMNQAQAIIRAGFEKFYEETWIHRPLKSLGGVAPLDAAGHPVLKRKLRGIVQFLEECAALNAYPYDFNRLRRKLGLLAESAAPAGAAAASVDIGALGAAELAQLTVEKLEPAQLEQAYQTALHLDAKELAGKFAQALVSAPVRKDRPDRFVWFNHLIQLAQAGGDLTAAMQQVDDGEKDDCENNEGRRRNDYELRRAQLQVKQGQFDDAAGTFDRLIARVPAELRYQGSAAEAMLSARQVGRALAYAEKGLGLARQQNNRDMEGYFSELVAAAKKQG